MEIIWVFIGIVVVLSLLSGGNRSGKSKPGTNGSIRIDHPHVIDADDYECSACHRRFRDDTMVCPFCGTRFTGRTEDTEEWDEEEDELEDMDEEDDR